MAMVRGESTVSKLWPGHSFFPASPGQCCFAKKMLCMCELVRVQLFSSNVPLFSTSHGLAKALQSAARRAYTHSSLWHEQWLVGPGWGYVWLW